MDPLAQVGRHDERATSDAVGDDTAREQEDQVRRRINRNPNPKLERTAAQLKDLEWTCDVQDERAEKTMVNPATGACVDGGCSTGSTGGSGWLSLRSQIATSNVAVIAEPHLTANQVSIGSRNHCAGRIRRKRRPRNESCTSPIRKSPGGVSGPAMTVLVGCCVTVSGQNATRAKRADKADGIEPDFIHTIGFDDSS